MEVDWIETRSYLLQPNEVLECGFLRITNISKEAKRVSFELVDHADRLLFTGGPQIQNGLELRLR